MATLFLKGKYPKAFFRTWSRCCVGLIVLGSAAYCFIQRYEMAHRLEQATSTALFRMGFVVRRLVLPQKGWTTQAEILHALQVKEGSPLLDGSLSEKQARLEALPWVKEARLQRFLHGVLQVTLTERTPIAIFHDSKQQKFFLLDTEGACIDRPIWERFKGLPVVSGEGADQNAPALLERLQSFPSVRDQAQSFVLVHKRRWNLRLKNKVEIKLPEQDLETAFRVLNFLIENKKISPEDILSVDLRLKGRVILKLSPSGQAYFKAFKTARRM